MNAKILDLWSYRKNNEATGRLLELLDKEIDNGGHVKPIPQDLHSRIQALRAKAAKAHAADHLLKG